MLEQEARRFDFEERKLAEEEQARKDRLEFEQEIGLSKLHQEKQS